MKKQFICLLVIACAAIACEKGEPISVPRFMQLTVDAFCPDTSLFQSLSINDTIISSVARVNPGNLSNLASITDGIERKDSVRMRILIVKKTNPNLNFDSTVFLTNVNEFLLLQLDPVKRPILINKRLENATAIPPAKDSVKVRFYYNPGDRIVNPRNNNSRVTVLNLQLYTGETDASGNFIVKKEDLLTNIREGQLSAYFTLTTKKYYGATMIDATPGVAANRREFQQYMHDGLAFVKGNIGIAGTNEGKFQTVRIQTSTITDINGIDQRSLNGLFLFGLN